MKKILLFLCLFISFKQSARARECHDESGKYGNEHHYQDMFCMSIINEKMANDKIYRTMTMNDEGALQVMSSTKAATLSASMGYRVYYLLPLKAKRKIQSHDESHLQALHPAGVQFNFDKNGNVSSPDLKMSVASSINLQNKGGIEIESFPEGIVIDIGYRIGKSPSEYENKMVTITDKHKNKCSVNINELFKKSKYDVEFIYKTNIEMYHFLERKCSGLDLSDFVALVGENLKALTRPSSLGSSPKKSSKINVDDSNREVKPRTESEKSSAKQSEQTSIGR